MTTINVPTLLLHYAENARIHGHGADVDFVVVADNKTPPDACRVVNELVAEGIDATFFTLDEQLDWLRSYPKLAGIVPFDSDNRRNLGFLLAVERGADIVISTDDDNFVGDDDFFGCHRVVGTTCETTEVGANNRWFNPCDLLKFDPERRIYARGYPYSRRWKDHPLSFRRRQGRVVLNAGLWLGEPDVDAVTRLNEPVLSTHFTTDVALPLSIPNGHLCPINSQNTAFHRDVLPCYYFVWIGFQLNGLRMDRYCDIWSGLFAKKVIDAMGDLVTFGRPVCRHERNAHDLLRDLHQELLGMMLADSVADFLESLVLHSTSYADAYLELADAIESHLAYENPFPIDLHRQFQELSDRMRVWVDACRHLMS